MFSSPINISTFIFKNTQNMLKYPSLSTLGQNISAHIFFRDMRLAAFNSKYGPISHILSLGYCMTRTSTNKECINTRHSGPVRCQTAPNIFLSAYEFAKGKMFWNNFQFCSRVCNSFFKSVQKTTKKIAHAWFQPQSKDQTHMIEDSFLC